MASILKCDTLQKPDGSTPTAADLGIDVAGSVIQTALGYGNTNQQTTSNSTFLVGATMTFTPKKQDSKILIQARMPYRLFNGVNNTAEWISPYIKVNGSVVGPSAQTQYEYGNNFGDTSWLDFRGVATVQSYYLHNSTSPLTISIEGLHYTNGNTFQVNENGQYYSSIVVQEIAQ